MARFLIIVALATLTLSGFQPATAQNNPGATWRVQNPPFPLVRLQTVACPSPTVCLAAGDDTIFTTKDGGTTWSHQRVHKGSQISQVACVSASSCFALDEVFHGQQSQGVVIRTQDGGRTWKDAGSFSQTFWGGATCPTPTVCYVMGNGGLDPNAPALLLHSNDAGATWIHVNGQTLYSVSQMSLVCPGPALCYLGGIDSILVTHDGGQTWNKRQFGAGASGFSPASSVNSIGCPGVTRCYAVMGDGSIRGTSDGWATSRVLRAGAGPRYAPFFHITCPAASVCYVSGYFGTVLTTTDGGASWNVVETDASVPLPAIACATPNNCTAVGDTTTILSTRDTGATWQSGFRETSNPLSGVTCVDASTCTAVGIAGTILGTTDGGRTWKIEASGVHESLVATSCPTATVCFAAGGSRYALISQGPATTAGPVIVRTSDGGTSWTVVARNAIGGRPLDLAGIACPTANICYATSDSGAVLSTADGGQSWRWSPTGAYFQLRGIACSTTTHCVAVGGLDAECNSLRRPSAFHDLDGCFAPEEGVIFVTQDGGQSWRRRFYRQVDLNGPATTGAHLFTVSCPSAMTCLASGHNVVVKTVDGGQTWRLASTQSVLPPGGGPWPTAVSLACPSTTSCWASYGLPTFFRTVDGGSSWTSGPANPKPRAGPVWGLACPAVDTCYAVGASGLILRLFGASSVLTDTSSTGISPG